MTNKTWIPEKSLWHILDSFKRYPEIEEVIVFWSRALWNFKKGSDIDLAIKWENITFRTVSSLNWFLEEEIPVPYFFDVVDYNTIDNIDLKRHIDDEWYLLYQK